MHKFKTVVKKIVISNPKGAWLFGAFKRDGIRGVFFETTGGSTENRSRLPSVALLPYLLVKGEDLGQ